MKIGSEYGGFKISVDENLPTDVIIMAPDNYMELLEGGQRASNQVGVIKRVLESVEPANESVESAFDDMETTTNVEPFSDV